MATTSTQSIQPASVANLAVGRYLTTDAAAAIVITTGFKPRYVKVTNVTTRDSYEWLEGMADASALKITASTSARTLEITLGITVNDRGFTIGLDTDVNHSDEQISWKAIG